MLKTSLVLLVLALIPHSYGERTKDKMYIKLKSSTGCYRRMNSTHQIGCSSKRGGSNGVIHYCENIEDLNFILANGTAPPYMPVVPENLLTNTLVNKLSKNRDLIAGLVVHKNHQRKPNRFSHDRQCPNQRYGVEGTCEGTLWNPWGTGLLFADIPFPVFYIDSEQDLGHIKDCFRKFNNFSFEGQGGRSLCSLQLNAFMFGATSTPTCLRRSNKVTQMSPVKYCDPLGDYNVWSSLYPLVEGPRNESKPINGLKYIIVASRMDTTTLFEKTSGAESPISSIVTLLGVAKYLKTILPDYDEGTNVLFVLFNGETYDYIGSQRMLYDMQNGDFPVKSEFSEGILPKIEVKDVKYFVEINQISRSGLFVHYLRDSEDIGFLVRKIQGNKGGVNITAVPNSLPPASLHTFLKEVQDLPGVVITDHQREYQNHYYNSIHDNASNLAYKYYNSSSPEEAVFEIPKDSIQNYIVEVAMVISKTIYEILKGHKYEGGAILDVGLIDELIHCYLEDPNCRVHRAFNISKIQDSPFSLYVGIDHHSNFLTPHLELTLGWFTGDQQGESNINCTNKPRNYAYKYFNISRSIYDLNQTGCYRLTSNETKAVSPAFLLDDYDWSSNKYSSWSESTWDDINMRIFLKPSPMHETVTMTIGCLSVLISFAVVYFFKTKSDGLFAGATPSDTPTEC